MVEMSVLWVAAICLAFELKNSQIMPFMCGWCTHTAILAKCLYRLHTIGTLKIVVNVLVISYYVIVSHATYPSRIHIGTNNTHTHTHKPSHLHFPYVAFFPWQITVANSLFRWTTIQNAVRFDYMTSFNWCKEKKCECLVDIPGRFPHTLMDML